MLSREKGGQTGQGIVVLGKNKKRGGVNDPPLKNKKF